MSSRGFDYQVTETVEQFKSPVFTIVTDTVTMPGGVTVKRDYMRHVGAVGAVAVDEQDRVVLVRQYRHPLREYLWELPAGLIDVPGEELVHAAARELAEEADLVAARWQMLVDIHTTPGCSNEVIRLFLARNLAPVTESSRHKREHEEADMTTTRVRLDEAVAMIFRGEITNAACVTGVLAAVRLRAEGWPATRPIDSPLIRRT